MQLKNLLIALLAITNLISLFVIVKQKSSNSYDIETYDKGTLDTLKQKLFKQYNVSAATCGGAISLAERNSFYGSSRLDVACLLQGSRRIVWLTMQDLKRELLDEYSLFEQLIKEDNIQEIDGILYRPEGQRNALLFVKQKLLEKNFNANDYLQGYLLGYDEKDIEFFYQRWGFRTYLKESQKIDGVPEIPGSFAEFSPELKKQFEDYLKNNWLGSKRQIMYEAEKKGMIEFLEENKNYSDDQLCQQIKELKKTSH